MPVGPTCRYRPPPSGYRPGCGHLSDVEGSEPISFPCHFQLPIRTKADVRMVVDAGKFVKTGRGQNPLSHNHLLDVYGRRWNEYFGTPAPHLRE